MVKLTDRLADSPSSVAEKIRKSRFRVSEMSSLMCLTSNASQTITELIANSQDISGFLNQSIIVIPPSVCRFLCLYVFMSLCLSIGRRPVYFPTVPCGVVTWVDCQQGSSTAWGPSHLVISNQVFLYLREHLCNIFLVCIIFEVFRLVSFISAESYGYPSPKPLQLVGQEPFRVSGTKCGARCPHIMLKMWTRVDKLSGPNIEIQLRESREPDVERGGEGITSDGELFIIQYKKGSSRAHIWKSNFEIRSKFRTEILCQAWD